MRMVNTAYIGQNVSDLGRKLQKLDGAFGMNSYQLVNIVFKELNNMEQRQNQDDQD